MLIQPTKRRYWKQINQQKQKTKQMQQQERERLAALKRSSQRPVRIVKPSGK